MTRCSLSDLFLVKNVLVCFFANLLVIISLTLYNAITIFSPSVDFYCSSRFIWFHISYCAFPSCVFFIFSYIWILILYEIRISLWLRINGTMYITSKHFFHTWSRQNATEINRKKNTSDIVPFSKCFPFFPKWQVILTD